MNNMARGILADADTNILEHICMHITLLIAARMDSTYGENPQ